MYLILVFENYAAESRSENVSRREQRHDPEFVCYKRADVGVIT
jgi:hypothetical protein